MDRTQQVLQRLKTKVSALGFNQRELKGIAARIADNLDSAEDAPDEEVNTEIDTRIEAVTPFLSFGQSQANRLLDEWKKSHPEPAKATTSTEEGTTGEKATVAAGKGDSKPDNSKEDNAMPAWARTLTESIKSLSNEMTAMKSERTQATRKERLEAILKDTGAFGASTLKSFGKMRFESDDEYGEYLADVEADVKAWRQERANAGLGTMRGPLGVSGASATSQQTLSEKEIDELAATL